MVTKDGARLRECAFLAKAPRSAEARFIQPRPPTLLPRFVTVGTPSFSSSPLLSPLPPLGARRTMSFRLKSLKLRRERAGRFKDTNESGVGGGSGTRSVPGTPPLERAKTVATGLGQGWSEDLERRSRRAGGNNHKIIISVLSSRRRMQNRLTGLISIKRFKTISKFKDQRMQENFQI